MEERRQLHQHLPVPGQRAEVLRLHRRVVHRPGHATASGPTSTSPRINKETGKFQTRGRRSARPQGMGWEYLDGNRERPGRRSSDLATCYGKSYDMVEDAVVGAKQVHGRCSPPNRWSPASTTWCSSPSHLWLTIHESVGHAARARPRARLRGQLRRHQLRHPRQVGDQEVQLRLRQAVNLFADKTQPGVARLPSPTTTRASRRKEWPIWSRTAPWSTTRRSATSVHILGEKESHGCCYADGFVEQRCSSRGCPTSRSDSGARTSSPPTR